MPAIADLSAGMISAHSCEGETEAAASALKRALGDAGCALILAFFSSNRDPHAVAAALARHFPQTPVVGCSTAGEIQSGTMLEGSITLTAFPHANFRAGVHLIQDIRQLTTQSAYEAGRQLRGKLVDAGLEFPRRDKSFAVMLVDGLANREEHAVTAARCALGEIPLIGGSAGDSQLFREATLIYNGTVVRDAAVLMLLETDLPFQTFRLQNFEPTPRRYVITAADTDRRVVHELNAAPAADEYARALGLTRADLSPAHFAAHPFIVRAGKDYFCRAIRQMNPDGSLSFFCAIDEGMVLTLAQQKDMVDVTASALADIDEAIGGIDAILGFDCLWRKIEIENRQMTAPMEAVYRRFRVNGFNTYGEQFNGIHLNQTLTGLALGRPRHAAA